MSKIKMLEEEMSYRFEANGKQWITDEQTITLMREYREKNNQYMVSVVFGIGREFGRIVEAY